MRRTTIHARLALLACACACSAHPAPPADVDAAAIADAAPAAPDADLLACAPFGAPGRCITTAACAALGDHTSYPGYCPGPADVQCCIVTPSVNDNPPTPTGYRLMAQAD